MPIDEAIEHGKEQLEIFGGEHKEFIEISIDTMRKYQKIVQIMNVGKNSNNTNIVDTWLYENISKVLSEQGEIEDGNDD